jgi:hypothetical protein
MLWHGTRVPSNNPTLARPALTQVYGRDTLALSIFLV